MAVAVCASVTVFSLAACNDFFTKDIELGTKGSTARSGGGSSGGGSSAADDDADGLGNSVEQLFSIDSANADTDQDGFSDGLEFVGSEGDPLDGSASPSRFRRAKILLENEVVSSEADRDRDGLGDGFESEHGLNNDEPDTDGDGYQDGLELIAGSNPFDANDRPVRDTPPASDGIQRSGVSPADGDSDGLADQQEGGQGTTPTSADSDGDGFGDGIEYLAGSSATDPASVPNLSVPAAPSTTPTAEPTETESEVAE